MYDDDDNEEEDNYRMKLKELGVDIDENIRQKLPNCNADGVELSVSVNDNALADEINCAVCLEVLDKTWTVMACLHRFCQDCLHRCLRMELGPNKKQHECPFCRVGLASRRSSKADVVYDQIVALMKPKVSNEKPTTSGNSKAAIVQSNMSYQEIAAFRKLHENKIANFKFKQEVIRRQQQLISKKKYEAEFQQMQMFRASKLAQNVGNLNRVDIPNVKINIALQPWPLNLLTGEFDRSEAGVLQRPYIQVPAAMTIEDIKNYLCVCKPNSAVAPAGLAPDHFHIGFLHTDTGTAFSEENSESLKQGGMTELLGHMCVYEVCTQLWNKESPLVFYYHIAPAAATVMDCEGGVMSSGDLIASDCDCDAMEQQQHYDLDNTPVPVTTIETQIDSN